jgi:Uma2 family endonuclease
MASQPLPLLSAAEYFALERESPQKHEYFRGELFAMAGGSFRHSQISSAFIGELRARLKGSGCHVLNSDMRICVDPSGLCTYPDISVVCGNPQFLDERSDTLLNPVLLIEVLSPSTERHDRAFKFSQYMKLASLREYALVSQAEPRVELYRRVETGHWLAADWRGLQATCEFSSVNCRVPLADIYNDVS